MPRKTQNRGRRRDELVAASMRPWRYAKENMLIKNLDGETIYASMRPWRYAKENFF